MTLTEKDAKVLADRFDGEVPDVFPEQMVLAELRSNHFRAGLG